MAIMSRTAASWATLSPVAWPNKDFNASNATAWMRIAIRMGSSYVGELGDDGVGWRTGVVMLSIFTSPNDGTRIANRYAERGELLFRRKCLSGVIFDEPDTREIGIDDNWYHTMVTINFQTLMGE